MVESSTTSVPDHVFGDVVVHPISTGQAARIGAQAFELLEPPRGGGTVTRKQVRSGAAGAWRKAEEARGAGFAGPWNVGHHVTVVANSNAADTGLLKFSAEAQVAHTGAAKPAAMVIEPCVHTWDMICTPGTSRATTSAR